MMENEEAELETEESQLSESKEFPLEDYIVSFKNGAFREITARFTQLGIWIIFYKRNGDGIRVNPKEVNYIECVTNGRENSLELEFE